MSAGGTAVQVPAEDGRGAGSGEAAAPGAPRYQRVIGRDGTSARRWLGSTLPLALGVTTLFTLLTAGAVLLDDVLDLGVWFLSAR